MTAITKYLAGVLSVIALGVMVIAYSLVFPRVTPLEARGADGWSRPAVPVNMLREDPYATYGPAAGSPYDDRFVASAPAPGYAYRTGDVPMTVNQARTVRTVEVEPAPRRVVTRTVERTPRRNWKKAALVIGGSTAAGAGLGGILRRQEGRADRCGDRRRSQHDLSEPQVG